MLLSEHVYCVAITFKMTEQVEQQMCTKFCIKLGCSSMETIRMIQKVFGGDEMSAAQIKVWYKYFKDVENLLKEPHPARPATSRTPVNVEHVQKSTD